MNRTLSLIIIFSLLAMDSANGMKTRLIVTSDIGGADPDDKQSLVHLVSCLDRIDLEGFIYQYAWIGNQLDRDNGKKAVDDVLNAYDKVLPNLKTHSKEYPDTELIRRLIKQGQTAAAMNGVGEGKDTEGSDWIIKVVDSKDSRPVWIAAWSGMNTLAQALWKVKHTRNEKEVARFVAKLRVYEILGQDDAGAWIATQFPQLVYIRNKEVYGWPPSDEWIHSHIQRIGELGKQYPNRIWATEGDSPSFLYVIDNGLNHPEHLDWESWGGRFSTELTAGIRSMDWVAKSGLDETRYGIYYMYGSSSEGSNAIVKWRDDIFNDFAARMRWTVSDSYSEANHHPVAYLGGDNSTDVMNYEAQAGKEIVIDASRTSDPDGDHLQFHWLFCKETSTYPGELTFESSSNKLRLQIPHDVAGHTLHFILRVADDGLPSLASYRIVEIRVKSV